MALSANLGPKLDRGYYNFIFMLVSMQGTDIAIMLFINHCSDLVFSIIWYYSVLFTKVQTQKL